MSSPEIVLSSPRAPVLYRGQKMKKTFPFQLPGKADPRVLEGIKHDVRKYVKRERRKTLPEGFTAWDFNCKVGPSKEAAEVKPLTDVIPAIDAVALSGGTAVYVEILASAGHRFPAPAIPVTPATQPPPLPPP